MTDKTQTYKARRTDHHHIAIVKADKNWNESIQPIIQRLREFQTGHPKTSIDHQSQQFISSTKMLESFCFKKIPSSGKIER